MMVITWDIHDMLSEEASMRVRSLPPKMRINGDLEIECELEDIGTSCVNYNVYYKQDSIGCLVITIGEDIAYIDSIDIEESYRRKGIATSIIKYLINTYNTKILCGMAVADAIDFWNSLGADLPESFKKEDPSYLIPFKIIL